MTQATVIFSLPVTCFNKLQAKLMRQEAQLMPTNSRDAFRRQSRSPNTVPIDNVRCGLLLVCYRKYVCKTHRFSDIRLQQCRDLETRVMGTSRSLKMSPFDRAHMTSYWCSIVAMALSRVVSEIFNVEKYRDLEIPVKNQSRSLKVIPFDRLGMISY